MLPFQNDAVTLGILVVILAGVFRSASSDHPGWQNFYRYVPSLLLCYFLPALCTSVGLIDPHQSKLYFVASRYLLPASLVLLTLSIDREGILSLGPKALIMFGTGTVGIVLGGPLALWLGGKLFSTVDPDEVWRGFTTVAGSWIGGGANQTAMKEVFAVDDTLFSAMVTVDVIVANIWMGVLLFGAGRHRDVDRRLGANTAQIDELKARLAEYQAAQRRTPSTADLMVILGVGLGVTALSHAGADLIAPWIQAHAPSLAKFSLTSGFFWLIVLATTGGMLLSGTRLRKLEGVGASQVGTIFLYILVASIGMKMELGAIFSRPELFVIGGIWIAFHGALLIIVARLIRAPLFLLAVGSQANVGGAASAPVVASAFHPALAPVGVLLAVLGYAVGTYAAWFCGQLLRTVS